jgi:Fur family ferric uptake transcriptional regulator
MKSPRAPDHAAAAERLIREAGERLTAPRGAVLAALIRAEEALTHHEVEEALPARLAVDRVTVYRVLEWLVDIGLAHRIAGDDRIWRFNATGLGRHKSHAHFTCFECGKVICLQDVKVPPAARMPRGFVPREVELTIKGLCSACHG